MEEINEEEYKVITRQKIHKMYKNLYNERLKLFSYAKDGACLLVTKQELKKVHKKLYTSQIITIKKLENYFYINEEIEYVDIVKDISCEKKYMLNKYKYKFKKN